MPAAAILLCLLLQSAPEPLPVRPVISQTEGGLKAEVRDRQGTPVPGVRVLLRHLDGRTWAATTNAQGQCQAGGLSPGEYRVELRKEGHPSAVYPRLLIRANAWLLGAPPLPELRGPRLRLAGLPTYEEAPAPIVPLRREPGKIPMH
ncbi:MAG: carboxypeptidase-like regulatory domain-containing protein [Geothrix sp.]|uniref:carboxypeptidase-like regulatory domain-containing protein n=1 Tax=Geothrix sp. TaxID=1962974 RepID=UPI003BB181AC